MGLWDLITQTPKETPKSSSKTNSPYKVYQQYFSPYTEGGKLYNYNTFKDDIREVRNHGVNISSRQAHAMRILAKHENDWFNPDGSLKEGLSRRDAKRATKFKNRSRAFYDKIKPRAKKNPNSPQSLARWAYSNFIKNGYDTAAALQYANLLSYNDLANLWGGNVSATLLGGTYGSSAAQAEQNYFNSLNAPQKRAYLAQRDLWIKSGLITPASGVILPTFTPVSSLDMTNYVKNNISTWQNSFYGDNGYADEFATAHPTIDENTRRLYQLYGITPTSNTSVTWTPASPVRTSGFSINKPTEKAKDKAKKAAAAAASTSENESSSGSSSGNNSGASTSMAEAEIKRARQRLEKAFGTDASGIKVEYKNGKLFIDGNEKPYDQLDEELTKQNL